MNAILDILKRKKLKFWAIEKREYDIAENYFIFKDLESKRAVFGLYYYVTIVIENVNGMGESFIELPSNLSEREIEFFIDKAILNAQVTNSEKYTLDQNIFKYPDINIENRFDISSKLKKISNFDSISSLEFFVKNTKINFINSCGNNYTYKNSILNCEFTIISKNRENDSYTYLESSSLEKMDLIQNIESSIDLLENKEKPIPIQTGKYRVVLKKELLYELFHFYIFHAHAKNIYEGSSLFKKGSYIGADISAYTDPNLGLLDDAPSDEYGYPLNRYNIFNRGYLENIIAPKPYSDYLNIDFTGPLSNIIIEPGKFEYDDLIMQENTLIVDKVSSFDPKYLTGDFAAEIRSGYLYKNGKLFPVKGAAFSGNLVNNPIYLSNDRVHFNRYTGPSAIAIENISIVG